MKWLKKILNKMTLDVSREEPAVEETREQKIDKAFEEFKRKTEEEGRLKQTREELAQRIVRKPKKVETNQEIIQRVVMSKRRPASKRPTVPINYGTAQIGSKNPFAYDLKEMDVELNEEQARVKSEIEKDLAAHMIAKRAHEAEMIAKREEAFQEAVRAETERRKAEEAQRAENPDWGGFS